MSREQQIPFVLWVCAALIAHVFWSGSAVVASKFLYQLNELRFFAQTVRHDVAGDGPIEVSLADTTAPEDPSVEPPPETPPEVKVVDPEKQDPQKPPEEQKEAKLDPAPQKDKPIVILPTPPEAAKPPPPPPVKDGRIAVKQHVKDKNQPDNPNARFVGDEANKVEEESVARATSHDQDNPNPTFGGQHTSPDKKPGNADRDKVGSADDHPGDPDKAPGEGSKTDNAALPAATPAKPGATVDPKAPPDPPATPPGNGRPYQPSNPPQPAPAPPQPAPEKGPSTPDALTSDKGNDRYSLDPRRRMPPASSASPAQSPQAKTPGAPGLGLGKGPNDRGVQLNLNQRDVVASVGVDELRRQRESDGERRRSQHRGTWQSSSFARWRPAIENYVSSVRPGNQTALNTARVPFANYLVAIHNRIHPVFADTFLESLDLLPTNHPLNDQKIVTWLEIVLDGQNGRIVRMGVTRTSGQTAFDIGALDSVNRSQPFGKAPEAILSTDGNVYLHWEFHRNPYYACSTMNARPYMLNNPPPVQQPKPGTPQQPADPKERQAPPPSGTGNGQQYGALPPFVLPPWRG